MEFFKELQRRKVIRAAVVYVVTAWLLIQVADVVGEPLRLPDWFSTAVIVLLALGFPVALGLAWALEVRPQSSGNEQPATDGTSADADAVTEDEPEPYLITRLSVAVLPFENISDETTVTHIASGLTEETLNHLSNMPDLKVASRSSTLAYKNTKLKTAEIGEELGVSYLLEGSIRKLGDELRITVQLIRAPDDEHLWAQTFERDVSEGFAMQERLAQVIARQVQAKMQTDVSILAARRQTQNERAYRHFRIASEERWQHVSGNHTPNWKLAFENYKRAAELDPDFAAAHEGIANLCGMWFDLGMSREDASRTAHAALERSMALRPPSGFTFLNLLMLFTFIDANYPAAKRAAEQGLAIAPNMPWLHIALCQLTLRQGHVEDCLQLVRTALQLSPGDSAGNEMLGVILWARNDLLGAISALETSLQTMGGGLLYVIRASALAMVLLQHGEPDRANAIIDEALRSPGRAVQSSGWLCLALAQAGRITDVVDIKQGLEATYSSRWFPGRYLVHLAADEMDEAFRYLKEGIEHRDFVALEYLRLGLPFLAPMRDDPRWQGVMEQLEDMERRAAAGD